MKHKQTLESDQAKISKKKKAMGVTSQIEVFIS